MDLQKAIDQISNKTGESVDVAVGAPGGAAENVVDAAPVDEAGSAPANVGIGSMEDSVSASINQAISNVGMSPEGTTGMGGMAVPVAVNASAPESVAAPTEVSAAASMPEAVATATPEVGGDFQSVRKEAIEALLPVLGQAELDASEKFGIYEEVATGGNRDQAVISGMVAAAKEIPDEKEKARALLSAIRIIDGK
ncbi:MAG: hypothetical protein Q4F60_00665 [Candidatus Saccharibacteria bacterium]|nr:hypothetical protein [Candidatus Saccharibacteria bacterium]